jgi:hypothetical protein
MLKRVVVWSFDLLESVMISQNTYESHNIQREMKSYA